MLKLCFKENNPEYERETGWFIYNINKIKDGVYKTCVLSRHGHIAALNVLKNSIRTSLYDI